MAVILCCAIGQLLMNLDSDTCEVVTDRATTRDLLPTCLGMARQAGSRYVSSAREGSMRKGVSVRK